MLKVHISGKYKNLLTTVNRGKIFLIISLINSIMPILLCIISSYIDPFGAQAVMGIGYVGAFLLTFSQIGVSFAISTFFILAKKNKQENSKENISEIMSHAIYISIFMGIVLSLFFISSSYLYLFFSCNRPNTMQTIEFGMKFAFIAIVYTALIALINLLILYVNLHNRHTALLFHIFFITIGLSLSYLFGVTCKFGAFGIGLGLAVSSLFLLLVLVIYIKILYPFKFTKPNKETRYTIRRFKSIYSEAVAGISVSFYKGVALLILSLALPTRMDDYVPLSYQMSRVIWFNLMYALVWFSTGISDTIKYYNLYNPYSDNNNLKISKFYKLIGLSMFVTSLFVIAGYYTVEPLAKIYIKNDQYAGLWNIPPLPDSFPLLDGMKLPTNMVEYKEFIKNDLPLIIKNNPKWFLNLTNLEQFINWNISIVSFDLQFTKYNSNIITALINKGVALSPIEANAIKGFSSNTYIYIGVYSILCSAWTVILPATTTIRGKNINPIVLSMVYALILMSIIIFGTHYSFFETISWFQYLDAWTFPVMIVACVVFIYTSVKLAIFSIIFQKQKRTNAWNKEIIKRRSSLMISNITEAKPIDGLYKDYININ